MEPIQTKDAPAPGTKPTPAPLPTPQQSKPATPAPPARRGWHGNTKRTLESGCMLGAKWWVVGDSLACLYQREFETRYGPGHEFLLVKPETLTVFIDEFGTSYKKQPADDVKGQDKTVTRFSLPPLAGFDMALQDMIANGFPGLRFGDRMIITVTEIEPAKKYGHSDMPIFDISVDPR